MITNLSKNSPLLILTVLFISFFYTDNFAHAVFYEGHSSADTVRSVIITREIYQKINKELEETDSSTRKYKELKSLNINDTLSFEKFLNLLELETTSPQKQKLESLRNEISDRMKDSIVLNKALLSEINSKLTKSLERYDFYKVLNNATLNDTIPFRYIEYLGDIELYKKDLALRKKLQQAKKEQERKEKEKQRLLLSQKDGNEKEKPKQVTSKSDQKENQKIERSKEKIEEAQPNGLAKGVFRVQIAASRTPIPDEMLNSYYTGSKKIYMNKGEGWYRYSIGNCPTYKHAYRLKKMIDVEGAFEVFYKNGERLIAYNLRSDYNNCQMVRIVNELPEIGEIRYKVQVAASRVKMTKAEIREIYCGKHKVYEALEEGWYKYSIGFFENYNEALQLRDNICTPGAFVVAYKNSQKVTIKR